MRKYYRSLVSTAQSPTYLIISREGALFQDQEEPGPFWISEEDLKSSWTMVDDAYDYAVYKFNNKKIKEFLLSASKRSGN